MRITLRLIKQNDFFCSRIVCVVWSFYDHKKKNHKLGQILHNRHLKLRPPLEWSPALFAGSQSLPVYAKQHHDVIRRSFPLSVLPSRGSSGSSWGLRPAAQPAGGEHHWHVQTGQQQQQVRSLCQFLISHSPSHANFTWLHSYLSSSWLQWFLLPPTGVDFHCESWVISVVNKFKH